MSAKKNSNHYLVQGTILAAASLLVRFIGLIYRIPMNSIVGDEGMGYYSVAFDLYNIALILSSYSLPMAVSKLVATRGSKKEYRNSYRIFLCSMCFALIIGLAASCILFFGADFFAAVIINNENVALPLKVLAPTIFVFSVMGVLRGFFQGKNTMVPTAVSQVLEQIVNAGVSIGAAYILVKNFDANKNVASYGAAGGTLGTLAGAIFGLIFLIFVFMIYKPVLNKQIRHDKTSYRESYPEIFRLLILTIAPIILSQTVFQISGIIDSSIFGHVMVNKKIVGFELSALPNAIAGQNYTIENCGSLLGIYSNKYRLLTNVPIAVSTALGAAIITSLSAAKAKGLDSEIRSKINSATKFNMIVAIPSFVGMSVLASPILQLIFHDNKTLSANFLMFGSVSIVFYSLSTLSSAILQGINKLHTPVIHSAISLGIHIILVFCLLTFTPMNSYALIIGNVTFPLVICILNWISIGRSLNYQQEIRKTFLIPFLCAVIMGIVAYFSHRGLYLMTKSNLISVILAILVAVILYFILLILMKGVKEEEFASMPMGTSIIRLLRKIHLM